jgi:hypothetical protein
LSKGARRFPQKSGMCYNREAVKYTGKQEMTPAGVRDETAVGSANGVSAADKATVHGTEDASRYCPICSQRLESRRCKLICGVCGYYMSCADYY